MDCVCENQVEWNQKSIYVCIICEILAIELVTAVDGDSDIFLSLTIELVRKSSKSSKLLKSNDDFINLLLR